MVSRIKNYRDQLQFRILVDLRSSVDTFAIHQDERYAVLDDSTKSSIQAILECRKVFKNDLITHTQTLTHRQNQSDAMIKYYHDETLSAIEDLQSQSSLGQRRRHNPDTGAR
jgi:L-rhamnose isomerase